MNQFRDAKRQARSQLHEHMADTVLCVTERGAEPFTLKVRLHDIFTDQGALSGGEGGWAERKELTPKIRFLRETPKKGWIIVTQDMGAYLIEVTSPPHDITTDAEVARLSKGQALDEGLDTTKPWCGLEAPLGAI